MARGNFRDTMNSGIGSNFKTDGQKNIIPDIGKVLFSGGGSKELLGLKNYGSSEANLAHRNESEKVMKNIIEGGGDKVMISTIRGEDNKPIITPYLDSDGDIVYPNSDGSVRSLNSGFLDLILDMDTALEKKLIKLWNIVL